MTQETNLNATQTEKLNSTGNLKLEIDLDDLFKVPVNPKIFSEKVKYVYNVVSKYTGSAIMAMYFINNTPDFYQLSYFNQITKLVPPFAVGYFFGTAVTPIAFFVYLLQKTL